MGDARALCFCDGRANKTASERGSWRFSAFFKGLHELRNLKVIAVLFADQDGLGVVSFSVEGQGGVGVEVVLNCSVLESDHVAHAER